MYPLIYEAIQILHIRLLMGLPLGQLSQWLRPQASDARLWSDFIFVMIVQHSLFHDLVRLVKHEILPNQVFIFFEEQISLLLSVENEKPKTAL